MKQQFEGYLQAASFAEVTTKSTLNLVLYVTKKGNTYFATKEVGDNEKILSAYKNGYVLSKSKLDEELLSKQTATTVELQKESKQNKELDNGIKEEK